LWRRALRLQDEEVGYGGRADSNGIEMIFLVYALSVSYIKAIFNTLKFP